ncbi:MAG: HlyC/CorC family transporter [Clostridiales bacterium]|jgi:putative hemolysin|nr:HlyC/CorC family transporter [Clostridiales bacterium]
MEDDPSANHIGIQIMILVALTLINAFFACAEMAMVSVNKAKIRRHAEKGKKSAKLVLKFLDEPTRFLSTIQVAITLAGFFSSASAATGLSKPVGQWLTGLGLSYGDKVSFVGVTLILSYFTLVFGELVPKRIALHKPEAISMFCVKPIRLVSKIASPFIRLLTFSTNLVTKPFGLNEGDTEEMLSREEIKSLVKEGQAHGVLNRQEKEMIDSIMEFDDKMAKEVMTPRINVFAIDISDPVEEYLDELMKAKYSRIPVYNEDIDNIIGILFIKDFLREAVKYGPENVKLKSILRKPYFVPDSKFIRDLVKELQQSKKQIAILINEYGGFEGIVTMEDLVEEVMGEIEDEYDPGLARIIKIDENTYIIDGMLTIGELNNKLDLNLYSENYDTISGYLIDQIGSIPKEEDDRTIEIDNLVFKLESVKHKRIDKVKLYIGVKEDEIQQEEED